MRNHLSFLALALVVSAVPVSGVRAQSSPGFPFSIINDGSDRRAAPRTRKASPPAEARPAKAQPRTAARGVRRGSSTASTIPAYRSPLTPLGTAPSIGTAPSMANPASPATQVPGIAGTGGVPAIAPARPAGQGFQGRAANCIAAGNAQGVGAGQIGSFTQNCVNR
jgi:hypothetical protein